MNSTKMKMLTLLALAAVSPAAQAALTPAQSNALVYCAANTRWDPWPNADNSKEVIECLRGRGLRPSAQEARIFGLAYNRFLNNVGEACTVPDARGRNRIYARRILGCVNDTQQLTEDELSAAEREFD